MELWLRCSSAINLSLKSNLLVHSSSSNKSNSENNKLLFDCYNTIVNKRVYLIAYSSIDTRVRGIRN